MTAAQRERAALVETFRAVGPDHPTLCTPWTTRDLAAHLVLREHRLDAAPGITFPPLAGYTAKVQDQIAADTSYDELVDKIASGPPLLSPFKLLDPLVNVAEMFVHHEDVRRAADDWEPRVLDAGTVSALTRPIGMLSRLGMAKVPGRVVLRTPDGKTLAAVGHGPDVTVTAEAPELLLFAFGRNAVRADFDGDQAAIEAVQAASRGI
jgi:uncharacterized protein (TIGR03085 family)